MPSVFPLAAYSSNCFYERALDFLILALLWLCCQGPIIQQCRANQNSTESMCELCEARRRPTCMGINAATAEGAGLSTTQWQPRTLKAFQTEFDFSPEGI